MSEDNQKVVKYDLVEEIHVKSDPEILKWLKDNNYAYKIHEIKDLVPYQTKEEIDEKISLIEIPKELYRDLENLCKINNWDTDEKILNILEDAVFSAEIEDRNGFKSVINF